jgi:hypothetical protein
MLEKTIDDIDVAAWAFDPMTRRIGDHTQPHELLLDRAGLPTQFSTCAVNSTRSARTSACRCSEGRLTDHGFRNFNNYRLPLLLHCGITWHHQTPTPLRGRLPRLAA